MSAMPEPAPLPTQPVAKRPTSAQVEGSPLPLGATWLEEEQAFNFALVAEHAESVTLLLYSASDLVTPVLSFRFDFLRNKSGRIWHCRIPMTQIGGARYYAYSVSGPNGSFLHSFDPQKVLLDPYAQGIYFPAAFDREAAEREGSKCRQSAFGSARCAPHIFRLEWRPPTASRVRCHHL